MNKIIRIKNFNGKEHIIYLVLWLILYSAPILNMYSRTQNNPYISFDWDDILGVWKIYTVYLVAFLVHNFILAPLLVYKHKIWIYLCSTFCLIGAFLAFQYIAKPGMDNFARHHLREHKEMIQYIKREGKEIPDRLLEDERRFEKFGRDGFLDHDKDFEPRDENHRKHDRKDFHRPRRKINPPFFLAQHDFFAVLILFLLLGMNLGVMLFFKSNKDEAELQLLEKQNLQQQLEYLKYQINPHFFMNTLNNIHALVDIDPEEAKTTIVELSKMMRYILYEGNKPIIPLQREIQFLENYITLMKLRYTNKVKITLNIEKNIPDYGVPPLMLITFVENAFKHGVSYQKDSFIDVQLYTNTDRFIFNCKNSKHKESTEEHGGVGLVNVRKRLDLIYGQDYIMTIHDKEESYEVYLEIPLSKDPFIKDKV
ncbi:sensor histidine kinase [Segatella bryantii]|uniref:sensor histidine kinase n=1 Tax=Segatella bryantii TaxID=77095 RepID=UPI002431C56E|nr:histidine kinase [Segatella bryantii]